MNHTGKEYFRRLLTLFTITLISFACNRAKLEKRAIVAEQKIDSLRAEIVKRDQQYAHIKKLVSIVLIERSDSDSLVIFEPFEASNELKHERPRIDTTTHLSIPAAFTSSKTT